MNIRPQSFPVAGGRGGGGGGGGGVPPGNMFESKLYPESQQQKSMVQLVAQLSCLDAELRGSALQELSTRGNEVETLAPLLWHSFATIATLLREIASIYAKLSSPTLSMVESERVGYALVLLQFVVAHQGTRILFVKANIGPYLYPFISSVDKTRPLEHLRLTALGVIGTLVKSGEPEVIHYLLQTEFMPECLQSIVIGCDLSKTVESLLNRHRWRRLSRISLKLGGNNKCVPVIVITFSAVQNCMCITKDIVNMPIALQVATYILQKILSDAQGLNYICFTADRFHAVGSTLAQLVTNVAEKPSPELLKNIIRCYLYLTNNPRARDALCRLLPDTLRDGTFLACVEEDPTMMRWLLQLLSIVGVNQGSQPGPSQGF